MQHHHPCSFMGSLLITPTDGNQLLNLIHDSKGFKDDIIYHAKKLFDKVIKRFQSNQGLCRFIGAQPEDHMVEYAKFFTLKVVCDDINSRLLSPTPRVDKIWHAAYSLQSRLVHRGLRIRTSAPIMLHDWLNQPRMYLHQPSAHQTR